MQVMILCLCYVVCLLFSRRRPAARQHSIALTVGKDLPINCLSGLNFYKVFFFILLVFMNNEMTSCPRTILGQEQAIKVAWPVLLANFCNVLLSVLYAVCICNLLIFYSIVSS